jgi:hypothetical protein
VTAARPVNPGELFGPPPRAGRLGVRCSQVGPAAGAELRPEPRPLVADRYHWRLCCFPIPDTLPTLRPPRPLFSPQTGRVHRSRGLTRHGTASPPGAGILLCRWPAAAVCARMAGAYRFRLLFGPYRTLRFRHGGTLRCEPRKLGPSPPGARGWPAVPTAIPNRIRALLAGRGLPAPRGQGTGLELASEAIHGWSVGPPPIDCRQPDQPTIETADGWSVRPPPKIGGN